MAQSERLDRILHAEGDDPNRYKASKQADTVMLFFLFSAEELADIFQRLGYQYRANTAQRNVEYYDRRTSHGLTLSFVAHAGVMAALDPESPGSGSGRAPKATWRTFKVGPRRKASTPVSCPGRSTWCSGTTRAPECAMASCISTLGFRASLTACPFPCNSGAAAFCVSLTRDSLKLTMHPEGANRPFRLSVRERGSRDASWRPHRNST